MHLWDWRTGYNFQRVHAAVQPGSLDSESGIFACAFDQSESRLLTAEADKTIKVYREDDTAVSSLVYIHFKVKCINLARVFSFNYQKENNLHGVKVYVILNNVCF